MRLMAPAHSPKPNWPQRPKPARLRIRRRHMVMLSVFLAVAGMGWLEKEYTFGPWETFRHAFLQWTADQGGMTLRYISVTGRKNLNQEDLYNALMPAYQGSPLLAIDLEEVRQRLLHAPWVQDVRVTRMLPDRLHIDIVEAEPFALWEQGNDFLLVDGKGEPIHGVDPALYPRLPVIAGEGAPAKARDFLSVLQADADLFRRVKKATLISQRRWNILFDNRIEVKLPEEGVAQAWALLGRLAREQRILERMVSGIDLRLPDKIFLQMPTTPLLPAKEKGSSI